MTNPIRQEMKNLWRQQKKAAGLISGAVKEEAKENKNIL